MLFQLSFAALAGLFSKLADEASEKKWPAPWFLAAACAMLYGLLAGYLSITSALSSLFLALALSAALAKKIDHWLHVLGLLAYGVVLYLFPLYAFDVWFFALFFVLGLLDELELRLPGLLSVFNAERLWVPLGALAIGLVANQWLFLLAIISFDLFYRLADWLTKRKEGKKQAARPSGAKKRRR